MGNYIKKEYVFVEAVEKWSNVDVLNESTSNHFAAIYNRKDNDGEMGNAHKSDVYLNKYGEKILLQDTNHGKAVQNILDSPEKSH